MESIQVMSNAPQILNRGIATPFVKWAGGKRGIVQELLARLPIEFDNYYEPFVGGGALFFELFPTLKRVFLSDVNLDLIFAYQVIKKDPEKLIALLREHEKNNSEKYFYSIRDQHELQDPIAIAARFIYLNRTCYNGLFRTNNAGRFNVPFGKYVNPDIMQQQNILLCSQALKKATIELKDFTKITPQQGDFIYFDPPYHPTDENSFTKYTKQGFTEKDQTRLRDFIVLLHRQGVKIMLSNSDTSFIRDLYKSNIFKVEVISAPRLVNCKSEKRQPVKELIITNYGNRRGDSQLHGENS